MLPKHGDANHHQYDANESAFRGHREAVTVAHRRGPDMPRLVEVEDDDGRGVTVGEWKQTGTPVTD
jgi:hypothetical protein